MKNNHISDSQKKALSGLGLDPKQVNIYLTALEIGGGSIADLSRASGIERTGLYYHLKDLLEIGLLKESTIKKRTTYLPSHPSRLLEKIDSKKHELEKILPQLEEMFIDKSGESVVSYFRGKEGIINLYETFYQDVLKNLSPPDNTLLIFARSFEVLDALPEFFPRYIQKREKLNLKVRVILPKSEKPKRKNLNFDDPVIHAKYSRQIKDRKYIDDNFAPQSVVMITPNHVGMIDYKTFFGSITANKYLADTWAKFFEYIWQQLD